MSVTNNSCNSADEARESKRVFEAFHVISGLVGGAIISRTLENETCAGAEVSLCPVGHVSLYSWLLLKRMQPWTLKVLCHHHSLCDGQKVAG